MQTQKKLAATAMIATWSARHRWYVIAASVTAIILAILVMSVVKVEIRKDYSGNGDSGIATQLIDERFPTKQNTPEQIVFSNPMVDVDAPAFRATVEGLLSSLQTLPGVESVPNYYETADPSTVSADRHVLVAQIQVDAQEDVKAVIDTVNVAADSSAGFQIGIAGPLSLQEEVNQVIEQDFGMVMIVSLGLGLVILLLAFRAAVAAIIPLALALGSIFITLGITTVVSQVYALEQLYSEMVLLMGLAVGIDYSLFVVSRFRHERSLGRPKLDAISVASNTTGRAVLYAGITVVTSIAGLTLTDDPVFISLSLGAIIVVLVAVVGSLTLLPALLAALGDNINRLRVPFLRQEANNESRIWDMITDRVLARPWGFAAGTVAVLIAVAVPVVTLNLGFSSGAAAYPDAIAGKQVIQQLEKHFAVGLTQPAVVVIDAPDIRSPEIQAAVARLLQQAEQNSAFIGPFQTIPSPSGNLLMVDIPIKADPDSKQAGDAVRLLRDDLIPTAFSRTSANVHITGQTAASLDFTAHMYGTAPYVFGFVLGLAFVLLLVMFRSIVIPVKAIVLNLLSVGAAYGVLVLVFQKGFGQSILGFQSTGRIEPWLPLFLFAILFGLSMDYHMILLNRIKEAYDQGYSNEESVSAGIKATAGQITSAATIMVGVFAAFALGRVLGLKEFGIGLGVAVLVDATVIRTILLPASMKLLGNANWYLPSWLGWLPRLGDFEEAGATSEASDGWAPSLHPEPQMVTVRIDQ